MYFVCIINIHLFLVNEILTLEIIIVNLHINEFGLEKVYFHNNIASVKGWKMNLSTKE